jgi:magnesium transporter
MQEVHRLKRDILNLRKAVWPLREEIGALDKSESALIRPEFKVFLRDLYDHTIQVIDMAETFWISWAACTTPICPASATA